MLVLFALCSLTCYGSTVIPRAQKPKMIANRGATCFLNALLQALYCTSLPEDLQKCTPKTVDYLNRESPSGLVSSALNQFFIEYSKTKETKIPDIHIDNLMKVLREHGIISEQSEYQDPVFIYTHLCPFLDPPCAKWFTYFHNYFDIVVEWHEAIVNGPKKLRVEFESVMEQHVLFIDQPNVEKALKNEIFAIRNDPPPVAAPWIIKAPHVLAISYGYNLNNPQAPSYDSYPFPFTINLNEYRHESYKDDLSYELVSICIFSTYAGGHYATLCTLNNKWFYCDDSPEAVEEITSIENIAKNGYFEAHERKYFPKMLLYQRTGLRYWERIKTTSTSSLENELNALVKQLNQLSILD